MNLTSKSGDIPLPDIFFERLLELLKLLQNGCLDVGQFHWIILKSFFIKLEAYHLCLAHPLPDLIDQYLILEWLSNDILNAGSPYLVLQDLRIRFSRKCNDGCVPIDCCPLPPDLPCHLIPVEAGHLQIHEYDIECKLLGNGQRAFPTRGDYAIGATLLQDVFYQELVRLHILNI